MNVIGLMSGTSADGVDAALVRITGASTHPRIHPLGFSSLSYGRELQRRILQLSSNGHVADICHMNAYLGELFAKAALRVAKKSAVPLSDIDLIGSHGQTIHHLPAGIREPGVGAVRSTLQIADAAVIAERTGIPTIGNFRSRDMAAGGEGAPLVPYVHAAVFGHARRGRLVVNIGGISNVTYLPPAGDVRSLSAFDTGPGNMVMDALVQRSTAGLLSYDAGGRRAFRGTIDRRLLAELMDHPFISRRPPKSTGREEFGDSFVDKLSKRVHKDGLALEDVLATCAAWTGEAIGSARRWIAGPLDEVIVGGGGVHNRAVMRHLRDVFKGTPVRRFDDLGWDSKAFESTAFAVLAHQTVHGHCTNVPQVTGARSAVLLGMLAPGRFGRRHPWVR
jgi:anhydro-N-acetylmuramic acid kinase